MVDGIDHEAEVVGILAQRHPLFAEATIRRWVRAHFDAHRNGSDAHDLATLVERQVDAHLSDLERSTPSDGTHDLWLPGREIPGQFRPGEAT